MDTEYDRKFDEMKKYIPFLESMIKRLESTSSAAANPRQAQLDKIKSLRDLLQDKKKRMKMENLLKCEQVLVNLYAKVEQRDALPDKPASDSAYSKNTKQKEDKDLESVRNKLKSVSTNLVDNKDTLPEIARASEIEEVCTPGSKEPALFQRRPNLVQSISPARNAPNSPNKSLPQSSNKRNYTRVLVSPEPRSSRWNSPDSNSEKPLFSRRSPRRSPKRVSPAYHKKEKKKSKQGSSKKAKDLNITLNVPEESLDSLNTTDILTRIMKCNDNDVDIETLREAKRQILSELNQTGAKYDDISDLLLKSYKDSKNSKTFSNKKVEEVEEGELSDSESEAIESIYGDVLLDSKGSKGKQNSSSKDSKVKTSVDNEQPRKIQICLVINSDKDAKPTEISKADKLNKNLNETDTSDFQMYDQKDVKDKTSEVKTKLGSKETPTDVSENKIESSDPKVKDVDKSMPNTCEDKDISVKPANFYKPLVEQDSSSHGKAEKNTTPIPTNDLIKSNAVPTEKVTTSEKSDNVPSNASANLLISNDRKETKREETVEIPLLNEPIIPADKPKADKTDKTKGDIVSEIDILQALKNEILSESISIPGSDVVTPALHQPKLTKVASAQEIAPKKRISFEKYKEKAVPQTRAPTPLFIRDSSQSSKDDQAKKQSLKLTMKECERFNFPTKLALDEDGVSDNEETDKNISLDNIYDNIAPKSPDHNDSHVGNTLPIIIPVDSVKTPTVAKGDVDMRTLIPPALKNLSPSVATFSSPVLNKDAMPDRLSTENRPKNSDRTKTPLDPRLRRDVNQSVNADSPQFPRQPAVMEGSPFLPQPINMENPFPQMINPDMPPRPVPPPHNLYPNMTPSRAPNMTPSINPSMTPSRTPVMTPNARTYDMSTIQTFDSDENVGQKHVYTPLFTSFDREKESSVVRETRPNYKPEIDDSRQTRWDANKDVNPPRKWDEHDSRSNSMQRDGPDYQKSRYNDSFNNYNKFQKNTRYNIDRRDSYSRSECPQTPVHPFGRSDCPTTPTHPFGRHEAPMTPLPSFGRADCPPTPSYQFGRSDCPQTPSHPFGRSDAPATPSHPFGRSECPTTPSHPFGRVDMPMTPSHPFGRSENTTRDPRLNRSNDVDSFQKNDRDRNSYYKDRNSSNYNSYKDTHKNYGGSDSYRPYREQSIGRNDRYNKYSSHDPDSRPYSKEQQRPRREPSIGRGMSRDTEDERFYSRDRSYGHKGKDNQNESDSSRSNSDFGVRKGFYRERSIGRSGPDERQFRNSRATSVGRSFEKEDENRLSVKPHAGRSFTIDTSVTTTFQDFLDTGRKMQVFDYSFDSRRKRASSVGRSLCRESSVGRTISHKPKQSNEPFEYVKRNDFKRAASVGRDLASPKAEKSFKDIKAEFQLFKSKCDAKQTKVAESTMYARKDNRLPSMPNNRQSRKDFYENKIIQESNTRKPYSPRKNYRDPRMRKNSKLGDPKNRDTKFDDRYRTNSGIVYSNDNITKGTILGSGYGVKNYKIPKIKRPIEEPEEKMEKVETDKKPDKTETVKKSTDKPDIQKKVVQAKGETIKKGVMGKAEKSDSITDKKTQKLEFQKKTNVEETVPEKNRAIRSDDTTPKAKKQNEEISNVKIKENKSETNKTDEMPDSNSDTIKTLEKRVTRSSRKGTSSPLNTRSRIKKAVIYDTDSDEEQLNEKKKNTETKPTANKGKTIAESKINEKSKPVSNLEDNSNSADLDSSFGIDDLELFSDNIATDPVINSINALIADLDNDLEPTKMVTPTDFSSDISLETMLESITSQGKEDTKSLNEEESLNIISEVIKNDLNQSDKNLGKQEPSKMYEDQKTTDMVTTVEKVQEVDSKLEQTSELENKLSDDLKSGKTVSAQESLNVNLANRDDMVTTSDNDNVQQPDKVDKSEEQMDVDGSSTPDSTINTIELTQNKPIPLESIPDSTNEVQNEPNSTVSSTHDNAELSNSNKDTTPAIDSIGNILSILQNKSKIKELLSMLGEQSADNDKIKKKLEKLSEIVSDEEDDSKDNIENDSKDNIESNKKEDEHDETTSASVEAKELELPNKNDLKDEDSSVKLKDDNQKDDLKESNKVTEQNDAIGLEKPTECGLAKKDSNKEIEQNDTPSVKKPTVKTSKYLAKTNKKLKVSEDVETDKNAALEDENEKEEEEIIDPAPTAKKAPIKRGRKRNAKWKPTKNVAIKAKRVTRSSNLQAGSSKKRKNELLKLQEDIKEMFMRDEVLNATGIRMCRLAKLVDDKKEESATNEPTPVVVVEKVKEMESREETQSDKSSKMKIKQKNKQKLQAPAEIEKTQSKVKPSKYKPGPKSKTKHLQRQDDDDDDPYAFESDSVSDMMNDEASTKSNDGKEEYSSDSEDESLASSRSVGSSELLSELKRKPKRKRSSWQSGVIKPRSRKKKPDVKQSDAKQTDAKQTEISLNDDTLIAKKPVRASPATIPDPNCFTDKLYCFRKDVFEYPCRLCTYIGPDIVHHYKQQHPHSEIPLSRMNPETARDAIEQCEEINFQAVSKIPTDKYVCRFCYKEFGKKKSGGILESFFWHVVSMHTGEYKKLCSECINITRCPFNLDIPPPPKDAKGQLIGYICEKCNFTQISLENLKTHVIVRHNDEQTEVYTINLAVMSKKMINALLKKYSAATTSEPEHRVLRSSRSNQSMEASDDRSDVTDSDHTNEPIATRIKRKKKLPSVPDDTPAKSTYHSKIMFENDDHLSDNASNGGDSVSTIKVEREDLEDDLNPETTHNLPEDTPETYAADAPADDSPQKNPSDDIFAYPHFKITFTDAGLKEYVCCINGVESHYKTTLLISMKKHVQTKHSELWDGYCFVCKVIVTPQGQHNFKECFQHYLDTHMDNFPVLEKPVQTETPVAPTEVVTPPKPKIHVRPLSELISTEEPVEAAEELPTLPKIESIVSLSAQPEELTEPEEPIYEPPPVTEPEIPFKYEEVQAEVMSKKQQVVLATMITKEKLMNVYKCAGRYCSYTTDFVEDALQHASTHQRIGGENAMICAYCNFDCMGNTIDLVMHVFKSHGSCPYVCGHCFYRAAASQLVTAHISKTHRGLKPVVLRSTVAPPPAPKDTSMLTREQSVQYYVCAHGSCKFRTYTAKKFFEHLLQTHPTEPTRPCYLCSTTPPPSSPTELIQHMKSHDLNVYQCTWCVHGADNEAALLAHMAAKHPTKQPQAYLRVITKKDGSEEYRVLPLASFNKSKVPFEEVPPSGNKDNPVREAERSIELEKLIGHTNQMIESMATMTPVEPSVPPSAPVEAPNTQAVITKITPPVPEAPPAKTVETQPEQTPPPTTLEEERSQMRTPILKTEPEDNPTPSKDSSGDVIYCLDSDDEVSTHNVIDLSEEEATNTSASVPESTPVKEAVKKSHFIKLPPNELFKCPNCFMTFKNVAGFKRHTNICFVSFEGPIICAHCSKEVVDREELIVHYTSDHDPAANDNASVCGLCAARFPTIGIAKRHMKVSHKVSRMLVTSTKLEDQSFVYTIKPMTGAEKPAPKRKLSSSNVSEPPAKKRFGPQDVDQLPINPILDELVYCSECEFNTKVRLNMVRHLQLHAQQQPAPNTAPVNPVPHLETNEMHFDRMVNLASSSIVTRAPDKTTTHTTTVTSQISAEEASRYPKLIAERQRYACGAKDCSYISLDEAMFNRHWNTLHNTLNHFNCIHCSRNLFDSRPLTFERVMDHLKMHDSTLYGCSSCLFCHYKKEHVEAHLASVHKAARLIVIREEVETVQSGPSTAASRMDLKLWQCGLCPFRSLLRPAIIEHCGKMHQSKMQYKCGHCPFRASSLENVQKHQTNSHPDKAEEIFYYFYQDGTVPEEPDGVPKWQKQRQKVGVTEPESEVKTEQADSSLAQLIASPQKPMTPVAASSPVPSVDLNIVKQELTESFPDDDQPLDSLCRKYGQFCEPNGLSYKCPLCSVVEDTLELMQSHLFEELKYRRWACAMCPYRAYHSAGLAAHVAAEHRGRRLPPRALPRDLPVEKWVAALLQHQTAAIATNKENLAKQKILTERPPKPSKPEVAPSDEPKPKPTMTELEKAFGPFGQPANMMYCCPKCTFKVKEEAAMRDHLESELTKIRWHCSHCTVTFQTYHEAQFHCKSVHPRQAARPREAARDPALRAAWLAAALQVQKLSMKSLPITHAPEPPPAATDAAPDNSLLVVRYEESVSTEEPQPRNPPAPPPAARKRPVSTDSDDDRLVIDEPAAPVARKRTAGQWPGGKCPYCDLQTKYNHVLRDHICNSHYGIKPYTCTLCNYQNFRNKVKAHVMTAHPHHEPNALVRPTPLPARGPDLGHSAPKCEVCLTCQAVLSQAAVEVHRRENIDHAFAAKGDVIVKCSLCLDLHIDVSSLREHHARAHANTAMDYAHFRILNDERDIRQCGYCSKRSINAKDMNTHLATAHPDLPAKFKDVPQLTFVSSSSQDEAAGVKRKLEESSSAPSKKVARKSTTKLPGQAVAKKSTTKLPFHSEETELEYSYYGTRPKPIEEYSNVTTLMSFCNTMVPFTMKKLSEIIKINPLVILKDVGQKQPSE